MRRIAGAMAVALLAITTVIGQEAQPRFRTGVDLVLVSAVVRDGQNEQVRALSRDSFELYEDGKPIPIASFAEVNADDRVRKDEGRFVVLLLDNLIVAPEFAYRVKEIAYEFASRMSPRDVMSVVMVNGSAATTTSSVTRVRAAIDGYKHFGSTIMPSLEQHALDTVGELSQQLAKAPHRRKVLVCIGPARIFNIDLGSLTQAGRIERVLREVARSNVTVYVIDPLGLTGRGAPGPIDGSRAGEPQVSKGSGVIGNLEGFARETGGLAFGNVNVFAPAIDQIWEESGSYYLIGYEPTRNDGRLRTIDVRVKLPGLQVRARRSRG